MNSGYLLKWFVPVKVQDEERPTSPALLRSSSSHTPYSKDTSGTLLLLLLLEVYENGMGIVNDLRGVSGGPFIGWEGRFPPSSDMETLITAFGRIREDHRPRRTWTGASSGSAEPVVRPAPFGRLTPLPLARWLTCGSSLVYVGAGPLYVGLLCQSGPLCKCDAGLDILCICVTYFVCFCLIPRMGACNPRITKTRING